MVSLDIIKPIRIITLFNEVEVECYGFKKGFFI